MSRAPMMAGLISAANFFAPGLSATAAEPSQPSQVAPVAPVYTTANTDISTLLDNTGAKALLDKHVPQFVANEQIAIARSMTLNQIQSFASDILTEEKLAKIDADFAKLPRK